MQHIMVEVQDRQKAQMLYRILEALDFVTQISTDDHQISQMSQPETTDRTEEFFSYAGLWSDREISIATLRQQAWPRQSA